MPVIQITECISSCSRVITLLNSAQTVCLLADCHKPVHICSGFFHDLLNCFHTFACILLYRISLPLDQNRITEHLMSEKHRNRMTEEIILNLLMYFCLPV